jgi:hypothetical protein
VLDFILHDSIPANSQVSVSLLEINHLPTPYVYISALIFPRHFRRGAITPLGLSLVKQLHKSTPTTNKLQLYTQMPQSGLQSLAIEHYSHNLPQRMNVAAVSCSCPVTCRLWHELIPLKGLARHLFEYESRGG